MVSRSREFFAAPDELAEIMSGVCAALDLRAYVRESRRSPEFLRMSPDERRRFIAQGGGRRVWEHAFTTCEDDVRGRILQSQASDAEDRALFLGSESVDVRSLSVDAIALGKLGWLQCDIPSVEGNTLFMVQFGTKSDWYDDGTNHENRRVLSLFRRAYKLVRGHLEFPVWAVNPVHGPDESIEYPDLGYTAGAAEWERRGGELRQIGVKNVRFFTQKPD